MKILNRTTTDEEIIPIVHKGRNSERIGKIMIKEELHEFGVSLLTAYFNNIKGG